VTTQNEAILQKLGEIGEDLAVVKSKLPDMAAQSQDHEKRIRSLEARLWYATGVLGLLAIAIPLVVEWLVHQ
jgi:hypothetical protein